MTQAPHSPDSAEPSALSREKAVRHIRTTVLERIAQAQTPQHLTVPAGDDGWQPFLEGIQLKLLREEGNTLSYFLKLAPGAVLPAHRHLQDEECVVLQGELRIGDALAVRAGDYHLGRAGVLHAAIASDQGALIFLRGAAPEVSHFL